MGYFLQDGYYLYPNEKFYSVHIGDCKDKDIVIPNYYNVLQVRRINSFSGNIKSIAFSKNITIIDSKAFEGCHNLENVFFAGTITDWCNIEIGFNPME